MCLYKVPKSSFFKKKLVFEKRQFASFCKSLTTFTKSVKFKNVFFKDL